jgi:hypothetical protein
MLQVSEIDQMVYELCSFTDEVMIIDERHKILCVCMKRTIKFSI